MSLARLAPSRWRSRVCCASAWATARRSAGSSFSASGWTWTERRDRRRSSAAGRDRSRRGAELLLQATPRGDVRARQLEIGLDHDAAAQGALAAHGDVDPAALDRLLHRLAQLRLGALVLARQGDAQLEEARVDAAYLGHQPSTRHGNRRRAEARHALHDRNLPSCTFIFAVSLHATSRARRSPPAPHRTAPPDRASRCRPCRPRPPAATLASQRRLLERAAARQRQRGDREHRVAGAGDVEDLARGGRESAAAADRARHSDMPCSPREISTASLCQRSSRTVAGLLELARSVDLGPPARPRSRPRSA